MSEKVAVVIPFYQRQSGVLQRAIASVLNQSDTHDPLLIIVDDESPVSGRDEVVPFLPAYAKQIILIEQKNGGAAAARNAGLDHVPNDIQFVAFLDSDDEWAESHLRRAVWALENGFDFYFSDFYQLNQTISAFQRSKRIDVNEHPRLQSDEPIHKFQGDMFEQILGGNILGTSTVVYNYRRFPDVRYPTGFRHTGEEYLFWLYLAKRTQKIAFSSDCECRYGIGVNIFADSGWGTDKYLTIRHDEMKWRKYVLTDFALTAHQVDLVKRRMHELRLSFAGGLIHNALHNRRVNRDVVINQIKMDPLTFPAVFLAAAEIGIRKIKERFVNPPAL